MAENNVAAHALALAIINDGAGYARRCGIARAALDAANSGRGTKMQDEAQSCALAWARVAADGARAFEREHGSYGASSFTVTDLLRAAIELAEYYADHVAELARVQAEG